MAWLKATTWRDNFRETKLQRNKTQLISGIRIQSQHWVDFLNTIPGFSLYFSIVLEISVYGFFREIIINNNKNKEKNFPSCIYTTRRSYTCCGLHAMTQINLKLVGVSQPHPESVGMGSKAHILGVWKYFEQVEYYYKNTHRFGLTVQLKLW